MGGEFSQKKNLSSDAKILIGLIKKQPLTKKEICEYAGVNEATFHRAMSLLMNKQIVERQNSRSGARYAIAVGGYKCGLFKLDSILRILTAKPPGISAVSLQDLASLIGMPPEDIQEAAYKIAAKYGLQIGPESSLSLYTMRQVLKERTLFDL